MSSVTITRDISVSGVHAPLLRNLAGYTLSLPMAFAAEVHLAEGQFRRLKSTLNEVKSLKFRFGTSRPAVCKRPRHYFEPLKIFVKKYIKVTPANT